MSFFRDRFDGWWQSLDHGQHIALGVLAPCTVLLFVVGILSMHNSITMPFRASNQVLEQTDRLLAEQRLARTREAQLQAGKDTDGDGISDLDEVQVTKTSPYLADTDSDGIDDGEELRRGTDPLCPEGRDCYTPLLSAEAFMLTSTSTQAGTSSGQTLGSTIERPTPPSETTPTAMRAYLLRTQLLLDSEASTLPDEAVVELYQRAYSEILSQQAAPSESAPAPSAPTSSSSTPSTNP